MILLALTVPISLIGIIYPFKPFHKRRNALFTLLGSFVLLAILIPDPQSDTSTTSTIKAASTTETRLGTVETPEDQSVGDEVVDRQQAALAAHQRKLDTIRKSIDSHNWSYARDLYLLVVRENYQLEEFIVEIEARVLELVRPIPASDHQANLDGYRLLATLRPENATYSTKVTEYQARISQARQSAITRLRQKVDRVEGITWFQHPNQPKYLNSRSTVYLYIGRRGETGRPTLRMKVQYTSSDWLFVEKVFAWHNGVKELLVDSQFKRDSNTTIWEWVDIVPSDYQIEVLRSLANTEEAILRFEGMQYRKDVTLSSGDKRAIREVLLAYDVMRGSN